MLRVVDYFSAVDRNGDSRVEFDEALKHCFPHVPEQQLVTLKKWLHPEKYDESLFQELKKIAEPANSPPPNFEHSLNLLKNKCEEFLLKLTDESDKARVKELQSLKKGFVSEISLVSILKTIKQFEQDVSHWMNANKSVARECVDAPSIPNYFSATIFAISSAIQKLSRQQFLHLPNSDAHCVTVYRGYKDTIVPEKLQGYTELGFLSSSRDERLAEEIARQNDPDPAKRILILQIEAPIGGFADISLCSQ